MFGYQTPLEIASQIKLEVDTRTPRIRLAVVTQLLEAGVPVGEVLERAQELTAWIGEGLDSLLDEYVKANPVEETIKESPDIQADVDWRQDGNYL